LRWRPIATHCFKVSFRHLELRDSPTLYRADSEGRSLGG
jgi:hypothetical protein